MKRIAAAAAAAGFALVLSAGSALAAVTFDPATGTGFVGKGDVQTVYSWNNAALQANHTAVKFRVNSTTVEAYSWECTNTKNEKIQPRANVTTSTVQGLLSSTARERNQITGFNITGFNGPSTSILSSDGPAVDSCPADNANNEGAQERWELTTPAGDPEVISSTGGLQVSINDTTWFDLS
jgi:hypothetical protein